MTVITSDREKNKIRESGKITKEVLLKMLDMVKPGVSTAELDKAAENLIIKSGGEPAFKGYRGYPSTICASVNEVVVHGIPSEDTILKEGDIISVDVGVLKNDYYTDAARTFCVGKVDTETEILIEVTRKSLYESIKEAIEGNRISDISMVIQKMAQKEGYKEVRMFVGHGVGKQLHEPPEVPNWGKKGSGPLLKEGLVLAIEPMINVGTRNVDVLSDGWTAVTSDGKLSAHFEDTIIVGSNKAEILT